MSTQQITSRRPDWIDYAEVFPVGDVWHVRYTSEPMKSKVMRVMGTNVLPLPFTTAKSFAEVFALLRLQPSSVNTAFVEARAEVR